MRLSSVKRKAVLVFSRCLAAAALHLGVWSDRRKAVLIFLAGVLANTLLLRSFPVGPGPVCLLPGNEFQRASRSATFAAPDRFLHDKLQGEVAKFMYPPPSASLSQSMSPSPPVPPSSQEHPRSLESSTESLYPSFCAQRSRSSTPQDSERWRRKAAAAASSLLPSKGDGFPTQCSTTFSMAQLQFYQTHLTDPHIPQVGPLYCFDFSDLVSAYHGIDPDPDKVVFDIGANKGFFTVDIYAKFTNFSVNSVWKTHGLKPGCPWYADTDRHVFPRVFAFEPGKASCDMLRKLQTALPLCGLEVLNAGMSDRSGSVHVPTAPAGDEQLRIEFLQKDQMGGGGGVTELNEVPVYTLDDFVRQRGISHIDVVSIDTETHDPFVIRGMAKTLGAGAIDLLCFEMNDAKVAPDLQPLVILLDTFGYDCFLVGPRVLLLLSNRCWHDTYASSIQQHGFNVLCVRRSYVHYHALTAPFRMDRWERDALWHL